jgi:hypothetical protein
MCVCMCVFRLCVCFVNHVSLSPLILNKSQQIYIYIYIYIKERLLVGTAEVDVDDIRAFTVYGGEFICSDAVVLWFWEYWKALPAEKKGKLLDFITASIRVPLDG